MATCSIKSTQSGKLKDVKICPPDKLNVILSKVFPKKVYPKQTSFKSHSETLGFHNLEKHVTSVLVNPEGTKPELILSADKPSSSSASSSKRSSILKGLFTDKKVDPKDVDREKSQEYELEHRDGRLGPREVQLQSHTLGESTDDPFTVIGNMNFQSVKATCCVFKGKWMYEVVLGSAGLLQIGWCTASCKFTREEGVGDTPYSYAFDGYREAKWNSRDSTRYGETWNANDVVTCFLDLDNRKVSFSLNGKHLGVAFEDIPTGPGIAYFPAFSVAYKEVLQVNYGAHVMQHPMPGYSPIQSPPETLSNAEYLVKSLSILLNVKAEKTQLATFLDPVTESIIASHIFKRLSLSLHECYVVESALLPFLYNAAFSTALLFQVLDWIWLFLEKRVAKKCVCHLLNAVVRHYKVSNIHPEFRPQKKYLNFFLGLARHPTTKSQLLEHAFWEKRDLIPHMFHIKQPPPNSGLLDNLTSRNLKERITGVEDIQRDILKAFLDVQDKGNYTPRKEFAEKFRKLAQNYTSSSREHNALCSPLVMHSFVQRIIDVVRQLWDNSTVSKVNYTPASEKHVKGPEPPAKKQFTRKRSRACVTYSEEGYLPPQLFYSGMLTYTDTQRAGGLASHLLHEHRELLEKEGVNVTLRNRPGSNSEAWREDHHAFLQILESNPGTSLSTLVSEEESDIESYNPMVRLARALLNQSSKISNSSAPSVSRKRGIDDDDNNWLPTCLHLLELTDGCLMLYAQSIHQQMDKLCSSRTKHAEYTKNLKAAEAKLKKSANPTFGEIKTALEQSKQLLQKHVARIHRNIEWLKATTYAPESQHNLWWLHQVSLNTVEKMSAKGTLFAFIPDFYLTGATRIFKCLREYFHPTQSIDLLPNKQQVLLKFANFLSHHHCDSRIIHTDIKTLLANTLASFVTYPQQVKAIEAMPSDEKKKLLKSLLTAYDEDKPWVSMGHRILAAMWRGMGFALRYDHPPYIAKVKRLLNREKDPYVSEPLLKQLREVMLEDKQLTSNFVHSIINHLNWCFSEFIGQMQEVHLQGSKPASASGGLLSALDAQSLRQVRIVDMLFEISVSLLRVLELTVSLAPEVYLHWDEWDKSEVLANSLIRVVNQILGRVTKKHNIFNKVVLSNHPGLRSVVHYPLLIALTGVLVSMMKVREETSWTKRATSVLLKDPGFNIEAIGALISDDPFSDISQTLFEDKPSTSSAVLKPRNMTTEGFSLKNREEVSEKEYQEAMETVLRIHKLSMSTDADEEPMDEDNLCPICYANELSVTFIPCGHTSCKACIRHQLMNSRECFFCKANVEAFIPGVRVAKNA